MVNLSRHHHHQNNNNDDCRGLWRSGLAPCFRRSAKAKVALVQGCEWTRAASVLSTRVTRGLLALSAVANTYPPPHNHPLLHPPPHPPPLQPRAPVRGLVNPVIATHQWFHAALVSLSVCGYSPRVSFSPSQSTLYVCCWSWSFSFLLVPLFPPSPC